MKPGSLANLFLLLALTLPQVTATSCRRSSRQSNHQQSLWDDDFPDANNAFSKCDGTITVMDDGRICVEGRVTYKQMKDALGNNAIFQPAAQTISVNGHLTTGSANVLLGPESRFLYDFVESYTVDGVEYSPVGRNIVDDLLAASRGTIDGFCLSADFQQEEDSWYKISQRIYFLGSIDFDRLRTTDDIGIFYVSRLNAVLESTKAVDKPFFLWEWISIARFSLSNLIVTLTPGFLYGILPVFPLTGLTRFLSGGTLSVKRFNVPLPSPDNVGNVENVQIDTPWENLMDAMENLGLFVTDSKVPLFFNVVIKQINGNGNNLNCWGPTGAKVASIDFQAPPGRGDELDEYIEEKVYPLLAAAGGDVSLHFGKRLPPDSSILQSAIDFYAACGVATGLTVANCYHPGCERTATPRSFTYPAAYFETR